MGIDDLKKLFEKSSRIEEFDFGPDLATPIRHRIKGVAGSALSFVLSAAFRKSDVHHFVVFNDREEAAFFYNDLQNLVTPNRVFFFPHSGRVPYALSEEEMELNPKKKESESALMRAEVLNAITTRKRNFIVVAYCESLSEKVVTKQNLVKNTLAIHTGDQLDQEFVNDILQDLEFERTDFVYQPGQYAIRGGIVDIWSFSNDRPFRVELFGDEVESLRTFDPVTQLSVKDHAHITIIPDVQKQAAKEVRQSILEFLPSNAAVWIKNFEFVQERMASEFEKAERLYEESNATSQLPAKELFVQEHDYLDQLQEFTQVEFDRPSLFKPDVEIQFNQTPQVPFSKNFDMLMNDLGNHKKNGFSSYIFASNPKQINRLHQIFDDILENRPGSETIEFEGVNTAIHEGFIDHDLKLVCYTDHQIFERYHRYRLKEGFAEAERQITINELTNLKPGDFVVHIDHGVGEYSGIQKIEVNGQMQEAIRLIYAGGDTLYVSIHSLHRISRYVGKDGTTPKINKLGTQAWANLKNKTKKKVKEIAYDLIKLYAERKLKDGFAFTPDTYLQTELESSFIYEDTPDQEKATNAVKRDMEQTWPMDRLVCGDVGFGKTEIAIRAAFKAATDGKQVAILAPTTILTLQHFKTFSKRLEDFPVKVDYVNRFRSSAQIKETLKQLAVGKVDILIGTHRIVSKDIKFADLGLLIIDEEQKFGVGVKDKLKTMKVNVDTLTLTATPIPRTLQFSLMGARDLSLINTPPPNRFPVQTELHTFNESVIRDAIYAELSRDGQIFFIHNRVQNIQEVCTMIEKIAPDAKVEFAHGQMEGSRLEEIMLRFIEGEFDVLVSTTIIESGLDIPNANTIIINQAQNFGLSDLHQMRGRVGRSNRKAFCYLLCPPMSSLTTEARKRLQAIEQFSDLGSGINIAMRDLDIRGAGNLLGGEQSGFISDIGYDTYQKILEEAIAELKENEFKTLFAEDKNKEYVSDCQLETDLEVHIPDDYINNVTERMTVYRSLADVNDSQALTEFEENLIDRFGAIPPAVHRLLESKRMIWAGKGMGMEKVVFKQKKVIGYFVADQKSSFYQSPKFEKIIMYVQLNANKVAMRERNDRLSMVFTNVNTLEKAIGLLEEVMVE
ncbi:MAG: transcription-repair coupling factor [Flavobacteriales bacterium]|nr:transcription-repair coupling factor [Flavobacteriales bacterium]